MSITSRNASKALKAVTRNEEYKYKTVKELAELATIRPEHLSKYLNGKAEMTFEKGLEIANNWDARKLYCREFKKAILWEINFEFLEGLWSE